MRRPPSTSSGAIISALCIFGLHCCCLVLCACAQSSVQTLDAGWPALTAMSIPEVVLPGPSETAQFTRDGKKLMIVAESSVRIWDTQKWDPIGIPLRPERGSNFIKASFDATGERVLTVAYTDSDSFSRESDEVKVWEVRTGTQVGPPIRHRGKSVTDADISPNGDLIATANWHDRTVHIWCATTGELIHSFDHHQEIEWVQFDWTGAMLITTGWQTHTWDIQTRQARKVLPSNAVTDAGRARPGISATGRIVVPAAGGFEVYDLDRGALLLRKLFLVDSRLFVAFLAISQDGSRVVVSVSGQLSVWDVDSGNELVSYPSTEWKARLGPGGTLLALASGEHRGIWDLRADHRLHSGTPEELWRDIAFSPDGRRIAISAAERTIVRTIKWITPDHSTESR